MRSTIEPIKTHPFCLLIDVRNYAGATEDARQAANNFHEWLRHSMLVCQAHAISSPTLYSISLSRIPALKHHVIKSFLGMDEANTWVAEKLASETNECNSGRS